MNCRWKSKNRVYFSDAEFYERAELFVALMNSEVTHGQVAAVLGKGTTSIYSMGVSIIKEAYLMDIVRIDRV